MKFYIINDNMAKAIIEELRNLSLSLKKIKDGDDEKFITRADETKIYILELLSDKNDKDLKKEITNKWEKYMEEYVKELPTGDAIKKNQAKNRLKKLLESVIKVVERRENVSGGNGENFVVHFVTTDIYDIKIEEVVKDTLTIIECTNKTKKEKEEAKQKLDKLRKELEKSGLENWKIIKGLIKRFADFSKDVFVILIPAIIKYSVSDENKKSE